MPGGKTIIQIIDNYIRKYGNSNEHKGKRMLFNGDVELIELDSKSSEAKFKVKSESNSKKYNVLIKNYDTTTLTTTCNCPYDWGDLCKHQLAALLYLKSEFEVKLPEPLQNKPASNSQMEVENIVSLNRLSFEEIAKHTHWSLVNSGKKLADKNQVEEISFGDNKAEIKVIQGIRNYLVSIDVLSNSKQKIVCNCSYKIGLCEHKCAALWFLQNRYGLKALELEKDLTAEKNSLLKEYGYSLKDNYKDKFEFYFEYGNLKLRKLDDTLRKLPGTEDFKKWKSNFIEEEKSIELKIGNIKKQTEDELIFVFSIHKNADVIPNATVHILVGKRKKNGEFYKTICKYSDYNYKKEFIVNEKIEALINSVEAFNGKMLTAPYRSSYSSDPYVYGHSLRKTDFVLLHGKINEHLETILKDGDGFSFYLAETSYNGIDINPDLKHAFKTNNSSLKTHLEIDKTDEHIILKINFELEGEIPDSKPFKRFSDWIYIKNKTLYKLNSIEDVQLAEKFENSSELKFRTKDFETIFNEMIKPLSKKHKIKISSIKEKIIDNLTPVVNLYLKEYDKFLLLMPRFEYVYEDFKEEGELHSYHDLLYTKDNVVYKLKRNLQFEKEQTDFMKTLHPDFIKNSHQEFFHIPFDKVLEKGWFFEVFDKIKAQNINVFGQNDLKQVKYNYNRPTLKFRSSSGIDWLDLQIQVSFGDLDVSLLELRKAIINKNFYIPLSDGSIGVLPEDWVARYAQLFRFGKVEKENLKISKMHFSLIDQYITEINNEALMQELHEKKSKLLEFKTLTPFSIPKNIKATLRHYQLEGFQWLNFLDEFAWGGCLADDMGLGKTLQVLTFLQHLKNEKRLSTCLVVVPTTLIFNWNNEVEKYCKKIKVLTHRGVNREVNHNEFNKYDIVLTTYGTLRSDIADFKEFDFHYVILDESQAIKNPASQISKAVRLLKAKNRFVMTGTPVENNTFDLYSQMDFLNPGFLGSQEFFRTEFANAIDKNADENKAMELRKMIAPFVLKRTKEEVASDLPEKTETILYCEMSKPQRKVYEAFRKKYRDKILETIEKEGMNKSGFIILEGLLKLRMICDSPTLVGDAENDFGNDSAKLEELIREISENAGHHKILVFSQFLKMLDLVKQKLEELQIPYEYLDGKTIDRKGRVDNFQNDDTVRVFLISLKAGGVGINLTEADYVYLIDPWWNPAVERQAIDRTHRIGQKKNVFAYKMICKDTIEEKIIQLQEKKKTLASNLIDTEKNILKKLNKDDIVELFG